MSNSLLLKNALEAEYAQLCEVLVSELSGVVVFAIDTKGRLMSWNAGVERMFGYPEVEWLDQSLELIFTPEDKDEGRLKRELETSAIQEPPSELRWYVRRDGRRLVVREHVSSLRAEDGELLGFSKMMHDMTERQRREEHLHDTLAFMESIVETLNHPVLVLDQKARVQAANRAFYRTFRAHRAETEGQSVFRLGNGHWNIPELHTLLDEIVPQRDIIKNYELEHIFPELGRKVMLLNASRLWRNGNQTELTLLAIEDITERKETERALAESENQRRLIMDSAPALIGYVDSDLRFRLVNRAYERWFGAAPADLVGKSIADLFTPAVIAELQSHISKVLAGQSATFEQDFTGMGEVRTLQVTYTPDRDEQGGVRGYMVLGNDITQRKKTETALRESEERWRGLFDRMGEGFFVGEILYEPSGKAADFRLVEVNPAFEALTGLRDAGGKTMREVLPTTPDELVLRYSTVVRTKQSAHFEIFIAALDNRWYEIRAHHTEANCFAVLFLNITERKRAEERLRESEQRQGALVMLGDRLRDLRDIPTMIRTAMELIGTTLRVARAGYGQVDATQEFVEIQEDWTNGQVRTLAGIYRFSDFGSDLAGSLTRGESFVVPDVTTHPITCRDSARWKALDIRSVVNLPLIENGRLVAVVFVQDSTPRVWTESDLALLRKVTDRTWAAADRTRALNELEESESFTRSVLASSPDCVKILDLEGRLMTMNEVGCHQMEIDNLEGCVGKQWPDSWGPLEGLAREAVAAAKAGQSHRFEGSCPTFKGTIRWWEVVATPVRDSAGVPVRILVISRDITDRKQAEQERERLTLELQRSNEDLSQFAHTVAHDLQSPLRGVTSFAQLLQRNAGGMLAGRELEFVDHIVTSARRMGALVDGLLQFAQVGQGQIAKVLVSMDTALDAALAALKLQIEEQGAIIDRSPLPVISGEALQLVQLFQNLIGNALKYRRPEVAPHLSIRAVRKLGSCSFEVQDNGEGIAAEHLKVIFDPLKRLHSHEIPGSGLGLAMCQRIVSRHGGTIWVESEVGIGSTFFFQLPCA